MLAALAIRDIVLIDKLDLQFDTGLSVLTGETGVGKSILLDSLALALGQRGDAALVRAGADNGQVTAVFDLPASHAALHLAKEQGLVSDDQLILRRQQWRDGRTRAFVNDQPVSVALLRQVGDALIAIHGQDDDHLLVDAAVHRRVLDAYGHHEADVKAVEDAWADLAHTRSALAALEERVAMAQRQADYVRHAAGELEALAPVEGEEDQLATQRQQLMAAEKIGVELQEAFDALDGTASPLPALQALARKVERKSVDLPLVVQGVQHLTRAIEALHEAHAAFETALHTMHYNPQELERTEERLFALRAMARKHHVRVDELPNLLARFRDDLSAMDDSAQALQKLRCQIDAQEKLFFERAHALSKRRCKTAAKLDKAVNAELVPLKLERATFTTVIETRNQLAGPHGVDRLVFHVQTNPGTPPGPLMKIASGGERARFMLALKVVLAGTQSVPTLIFDEIDTGVGGAVAAAIGDRLARLAQNVQVLCVTHAPQVAAQAQGHIKILKEEAGRNALVTRARRLDDASRREEIARMLSGTTITPEARAQAERLLAKSA